MSIALFAVHSVHGSTSTNRLYFYSDKQCQYKTIPCIRNALGFIYTLGGKVHFSSMEYSVVSKLYARILYSHTYRRLFCNGLTDKEPKTINRVFVGAVNIPLNLNVYNPLFQ